MPSQTTRQTNLTNHFVMGKLVIFFSGVVVLKQELFYRPYLIFDTLNQILSGPESYLLGEIILHLKAWGNQ